LFTEWSLAKSIVARTVAAAYTNQCSQHYSVIKVRVRFFALPRSPLFTLSQKPSCYCTSKITNRGNKHVARYMSRPVIFYTKSQDSGLTILLLIPGLCFMGNHQEFSYILLLGAIMELKIHRSFYPLPLYSRFRGVVSRPTRKPVIHLHHL
jgi:hypothetical protein